MQTLPPSKKTWGPCIAWYSRGRLSRKGGNTVWTGKREFWLVAICRKLFTAESHSLKLEWNPDILTIKYSEIIGDRPHKCDFHICCQSDSFLHTFCCQLLQIIKLVFMCSFCCLFGLLFYFVQNKNVQNLQSERCVEAGVHFSHFCESPENRWSLTYLHPTGSLWT